MAVGSGDVNFSDALTPTVVDINTVEQVNYFGSSAAGDAVTIFGVDGAGSQTLSVTPLSPTSANVFRDVKRYGLDPGDPGLRATTEVMRSSNAAAMSDCLP